jgi:hypothetical protein
MELTWNWPVSIFAKYSEPRQSTARCAYTRLPPKRIVTSEDVGSLRKPLYRLEGWYSVEDVIIRSEVGVGLLPVKDCLYSEESMVEDVMLGMVVGKETKW